MDSCSGPCPRRRILVCWSSTPTGTTAGFSGNGSRIFAQYLLDSGDVRFGQTFTLAIPEEHEGLPPFIHSVRIQMPADADRPIEVIAPHVPQFGASAVKASQALMQKSAEGSGQAIRYFFPALAEIGMTITGIQGVWDTSVLLHIGNPHCGDIRRRDPLQLPDLADLRRCDRALRDIAYRAGSPTAPSAEGLNLQWVWPESRTRLRLSIYERGEGPTPASGSSACRGGAPYALNLIEQQVEVAMPGGALAISIEGAPTSIKSVTLSGYADKIFDSTAYIQRETHNSA